MAIGGARRMHDMQIAARARRQLLRELVDRVVQHRGLVVHVQRVHGCESQRIRWSNRTPLVEQQRHRAFAIKCQSLFVNNVRCMSVW